jgi:hypothetical protein
LDGQIGRKRIFQDNNVDVDGLAALSARLFRASLELADAITEGSAVLGAFTEPNMPTETLKDRFVKSVSVVAKTEVVATDKLLAALADLSDVGARAFMELLRARMPLEKCRADINTNDAFTKTYDVDIDAVLPELMFN